MDTLTHGLLGAAIAAIPLPRALIRDDVAPRAALLACVLAAELPDIDYLVPASDAVLHTLKAHRGMTHALIASPIVALVAAIIAKSIFRAARFAPLYLRALLAVPFAHLLPDLWTGWGTRLLLPFSGARVALDWTMVLDPYFTLPLIIAAVYALRRRERWRRALMIGAALALVYVAGRVALAAHLDQIVAARHPAPAETHVFPAPLAVFTWRYVVELDGEYVAGSIALGGEPEEQARVAKSGAIPPALAELDTVREALAWARFPVVRAEGAERISVADLRYHLKGQPTLTFIIAVAPDGSITEARLERGGSAAELFRRWRARD